MTPARFERLLLQTSDKAAHAILAQSKSHDKQAQTYAQMRLDIRARWLKGWEHFDAVIYAMQQSGALLLQRDDEIEDEHSKVRRALSLLHAASTVVLFEIRTLLGEGLWSGAAARWRALHELTVTAKLIGTGGSAIASRYLDHGFVVQTERLLKYWQAHKRGPVPHAELLRRQERATELIADLTLRDERGSFRDAYGWAAPLMPIAKSGNRVSPTFDRLEKLAELDNLRLLVHSSHGLVHADSAGVTAAVVVEDDAWALGPIPKFIETVARPTLLSAIHCIAVTHLGFEPKANDFAQLIGPLGAAAMKVARWGVDSFGSPQA